MAVLEVIKGANVGERFRLDDKPEYTLGRHPDCEIVLDQGAVSRKHTLITVRDGQYFIEDLHSRNGTFVNGLPVQTEHPLNDQDRLKICDLSFLFLRELPPASGERGSRGIPLATLVDDAEGDGKEHSTIMSKLDISSSVGGVRLSVNPEAKLRAVLGIALNLNKALSVNEVLPKILDSLFGIFKQADRGFIILKGSGDQLVVKEEKHRRTGQDDSARISRTVINQVLATKQALLSADAASDFDMSQSIADFRIRSMMCAPLVASEGLALGVIQVDTIDQRGSFKQDDLDVLAAVATLAAIAIENARLHEQAISQQQVERDLRVARAVQQGLLPAKRPEVPGYRFFDIYEPAKQVGGDFYDYIHLADGRLGIVLADVSGKGIAAALVMARFSAQVRFCLASEPTAAQAVNRMNSVFCAGGWEDRFVTFVLGMLDPSRNELTVVNAGHMAPFLRQGPGRVSKVCDSEDETGPPLGVVADFQYRGTTVPLDRGHWLTMFTDGFSEAMNAQNEMYSLGQLEMRIGEKVDDVISLGELIRKDVRRFVGGHAQHDDMCLVCFGRD